MVFSVSVDALSVVGQIIKSTEYRIRLKDSTVPFSKMPYRQGASMRQSKRDPIEDQFEAVVNEPS